MKTTIKRKSNSTAGASRRRRRGWVVIVKNKTAGEKLFLASDWQHLTKADIDLIVKQINNPPQPSESMRSAEEIHRTILQLD